MRPLAQVRAKNFRSLRDVTVELQPLNVLVGPNASGKSNFLDVIQFLGDAVREDLRPALERRGGFERVFYRGDPTRPAKVEIGVEAKVTKHATERSPDEYTLRFSQGSVSGASATRPRARAQASRGPRGPGSMPLVGPGPGAFLPRTVLNREEDFVFKRTAGRGRRLKISGSKYTVSALPRALVAGTRAVVKEANAGQGALRADSLGLSTLPRLGPEQGGDQVAQLASLFSEFRVFDVDVAAARKPAVVSQRDKLLPSAANLAAFLHHLNDDKDIFRALEEDARAMIPGLEEITFRTIGGATEAVAVELKEQGLSGRTPLADASYGSIRALALLAMLYDPAPPLLTCVEEIDHGLHPYVFDRLVERLREASERTQLLVVTHSPALVNRLQASELIVCERDPETGETRMPAIDPEQVKAMEKALDGKMGLGELWFTGTLGGVP